MCCSEAVAVAATDFEVVDIVEVAVVAGNCCH